MREISPIERALAMLERHQREIALMQDELAAYLPADDSPVQNWIVNPLTGEKRYIKKCKP